MEELFVWTRLITYYEVIAVLLPFETQNMISKKVNLRTSFRNILFTVGLLPIAIQRRMLFETKNLQEQEYDQRFYLFRQQYGKLLHHRLISEDHRKRGKVLICGGNYPGVEPDLVLIKALELAGYTPVVLIFRSSSPNQQSLTMQYYRLLVRHIVFIDDFCNPPDISSAKAVIDQCRSIQELLAFKFEGARVGLFAVSTALRLLRIGSIDLHTPAYRSVLIEHLASSMLVAKAAQKIMQVVHPQLLLFVDGVYTPEAEIVDVCLTAKIQAISWDIAHRSDALILKRYKSALREQEINSLSSESWKILRDMNWNEELREQLQKELYIAYASGNWYCDSGTQFNKHLVGGDTIKQELGLDRMKKTAFIFPHILWDASLIWGIDLFQNYEEWLVSTVKEACRNDSVNWVIKIHPANVGKAMVDGFHGEPTEMTVLKKHFGELPAHISIITAENPISTYSLFPIMDYCLTVRGTVGIEAARLGIPVLTAGTGRYDHKGFTIDSASREEFLNKVAHIQEIPRFSAAQQELANRYAYGLLILRPLPLTTITIDYDNNYIKMVDFKINIKKIEDWFLAPDLRALSYWIVNSTEADFLAEDRIA